jgi:ABC-type uncharacterized transport system permease subunit
MMLFYVITALMYGGLSLWAWLPERMQHRLHSTCPKCVSVLLDTVLPAMVLFTHGLLLYMTIFRADAMFFGMALAVSAMLWLCMGMYWIERFFFPLEGFRRFIFPLAGIASVLPAFYEGAQILPYAAAPLFKAHFIMANMASGVFALLAMHAVLMLVIEHRLHRPLSLPHPHEPAQKGPHWIDTWLDTLPGLLTLEKLLFRLIAMGWVLLSLTLASGFLFSEQLFGHAVFLDQKTFFSLTSWGIFGVILLGRRWYGWRGRTALKWVLAAFGILVLTYVGSRWVSIKPVCDASKTASCRIMQNS